MKTEQKIINKINSYSKKQATFSTLQDGSRVMGKLLKMIEQGKLRIVERTSEPYWNSIGGAVSHKMSVNITVEAI